MKIHRKNVRRSGRIKVTENFIRFVAPEVVLEVGAGDYSFDYLGGAGQSARWLKADFAPPADIICDFNRPAITLGCEAEYADLAIATELLEHLLWPQALLNEIHRALRPNAYLIVSVPNCCSLSYRVSWLLGRMPSCAACGNLPKHLAPTVYETTAGELLAGHVIDFNASRIRALLEHSGFFIEKLVGCGLFWHRQFLPHWVLPASLSSNIIVLARKAHFRPR